jgi:hypothetical protein
MMIIIIIIIITITCLFKSCNLHAQPTDSYYLKITQIQFFLCPSAWHTWGHFLTCCTLVMTLGLLSPSDLNHHSHLTTLPAKPNCILSLKNAGSVYLWNVYSLLRQHVVCLSVVLKTAFMYALLLLVDTKSRKDCEYTGCFRRNSKYFKRW